MKVQIFGHKSPDTDSTGSPIVWAWYLNKVQGIPAEAKLLGEPNTEAKFVLDYWRLDKPGLLDKLKDGTPVIILDTNNPAELPYNIGNASIQAIIDHHKLSGGIKTSSPIEITMRSLASTATILYNLIGEDVSKMPKEIKGLVLSCILSDTLEFRSPTTTEYDRDVAIKLASELGIDIVTYSKEMFDAKSDVSAFSDAELLRMDSKEYSLGDKKYRISVLETTSPKLVLDRKDSIMISMKTIVKEDSIDQILFFVVDIFKEEATLFIPNDTVKTIAFKSFNITAKSDTITIPGLMSRKKQIIPSLKN